VLDPVTQVAADDVVHNRHAFGCLKKTTPSPMLSAMVLLTMRAGGRVHQDAARPGEPSSKRHCAPVYVRDGRHPSLIEADAGSGIRGIGQMMLPSIHGAAVVWR